jgi:PncC family amidohydrolase
MTNSYPSYADLGALLRSRNLLLVTAESCTGGLLGHMITNSPGSSDYYLGGVISYSNQAKVSLLGVQPATLEKYGAVSRETVLEMSTGVRRSFQKAHPEAEILSLATSGIAGPAGGSPHKPVGTVWIGFSSPDLDEAFLFHFQGTREEVKQHTALEALRILLAYLKE